MEWLPIETAPKTHLPWTMFVVIALDVTPGFGGAPYTSDPYCVWREINGKFARWPHSFEPTHWCPLPNYNPKTRQE